MPPRSRKTLAGRRTDALFLDAEVLFSRGQLLAAEGNLSGAVFAFSQLLETGALGQERYHAMLCHEVRQLLWRAVAETPGGDREAFFLQLRSLVERLKLTSLAELIDHLVLASLAPASLAKNLEAMVARNPRSIPLLHAAARLERDRGDKVALFRHLVSLGFEVLGLGLIAEATRQFLEAKTLVPDPRLADSGMQKSIEQGTTLAQAAAEFRQLTVQLGATQEPEDALALGRAFLDRFPLLAPALEKTAELALQAGDLHLAVRLDLQLARLALAEGRSQRARTLFREIVRTDPECDEALLFLATFEPMPRAATRDLFRLRIDLLCREGLFAAAVHHGRRSLRGNPDDLPRHALLVELCRKAKLDPSLHHLALGHLALQAGDLPRARSHFEAAIQESPDRNATITELIASPEIEAVIPKLELLRQKA